MQDHHAVPCAGQRPLDDSKKLCAFLLESAINELPEGTETILGIFDLRGFGSRNADLGFVRFLVMPSPLLFPLSDQRVHLNAFRLPLGAVQPHLFLGLLRDAEQ